MTKLDLMQDFPDAGNSAAWMALVEKALKGADFEKTLMWRSAEGLETKPLYTRADETGEHGLPGAAPYIRGFRAGREDPPWDIRQLHSQPDPDVAHTEILEDLAGGVTSIALKLAAPGQSGIELADVSALEQLLDGVYLEFAAVSLHAGCNAIQAGRVLQSIWTKNGLDPSRTSGAFNLDPIGTLARAGTYPVSLEEAFAEMARFVAQTQEAWPATSSVLVDATPYHDGGAGEALELACLCATLVAYLRVLDSAGIDSGKALGQMTFALAVDTDQFMSIAKLRAARGLIARIADVSGASAGLAKARLHATTSARMMAASDPWVNLLRTTIACSAGAMGGADSITVLPFTWALGLPTPLARRLARNIQIVLQEEASLGAVIDPAGGSWYVEKLTNDLAAKAWALFQDIERGGGIVASLANGSIQTRIMKTAKEMEGAVAVSERELTGVSAYPVIEPSPEIAIPHPLAEDMEEPAITVEPIPLRRTSAGFDRLRRSADFHFDQTGKRPIVFLANLGSPADFTGRSTFARNFFAAGGLEAIDSDGVESAEAAASAFKESGARLACICSSDDLYSRLAADTATALKKAGAAKVYLAGRPGEMRSSLREAGVGSFIHKGCDMLEVLEDAHDLLGIRHI